MSEEVKNVEIKNGCFCKERAKDILTIAIGSFVGVYFALSLFAACHRPHFPYHTIKAGGYHGAMQRQIDHQPMRHFDKKMAPERFQKDFEKRIPKDDKE